MQSRYYNPKLGRFINADAFTSTGQGLLGNNMFAYCANNPIVNIDSAGTMAERNAGGGGGGLAYAGPAGGHIVRPTTPVSTPLFVPYIPPTTTYDLELLRTETIAIKNDRRVEESSKTEIATLTHQGKKPVIFPENPYEFRPQWLIPKERDGSYNGKFIGWFIPLTKIEVFRWDENPNRADGPHYHIYGMGHFYPGSIVPEPFASWYFAYLQ